MARLPIPGGLMPRRRWCAFSTRTDRASRGWRRLRSQRSERRTHAGPDRARQAPTGKRKGTPIGNRDTMFAAHVAALNMKSPHEKGGKRWVNPYWRFQDLALAVALTTICSSYLQLKGVYAMDSAATEKFCNIMRSSGLEPPKEVEPVNSTAFPVSASATATRRAGASCSPMARAGPSVIGRKVFRGRYPAVDLDSGLGGYPLWPGQVNRMWPLYRLYRRNEITLSPEDG